MRGICFGRDNAGIVLVSYIQKSCVQPYLTLLTEEEESFPE
jgi:hypothetical protein